MAITLLRQIRLLTRILLVLTLLISAFSLQAQKPVYPPELPHARAEVYRSTENGDLTAWIFEPASNPADGVHPAIVFFFGGGWNGGTPGQFGPQAAYLAERGMVAIVVDYRVKSRQQTLANVAVGDAKAAIRWVRTHAGRLRVDPDRIAAAGGSAGGHLAAATAILPGHDDSKVVPRIASAPNALVLFNPVLITAPYPSVSGQEAGKLERLESRLGADPESMSPYHHIRPNLPPTIIFHGKIDKTVPYRHAEMFTQAMTAAGNRCELVGYPKQGHGFFNAHRENNSPYRQTLKQMDDFFVSLGWIGRP